MHRTPGSCWEEHSFHCKLFWLHNSCCLDVLITQYILVVHNDKQREIKLIVIAFIAFILESHLICDRWHISMYTDMTFYTNHYQDLFTLCFCASVVGVLISIFLAFKKRLNAMHHLCLATVFLLIVVQRRTDILKLML